MTKLTNKFDDVEYRHSYVESFYDTLVAAQLRALRKTEGLTQKQMAKRVGTQQSGISAFESDDYSRWSVPTLRKFSREFDVALVVKLARFSEALKDIGEFGRDSVFVEPWRVDGGRFSSAATSDSVIEVGSSGLPSPLDPRTLSISNAGAAP